MLWFVTWFSVSNVNRKVVDAAKKGRKFQEEGKIFREKRTEEIVFVHVPWFQLGFHYLLQYYKMFQISGF